MTVHFHDNGGADDEDPSGGGGSLPTLGITSKCQPAHSSTGGMTELVFPDWDGPVMIDDDRGPPAAPSGGHGSQLGCARAFSGRLVARPAGRLPRPWSTSEVRGPLAAMVTAGRPVLLILGQSAYSLPAGVGWTTAAPARFQQQVAVPRVGNSLSRMIQCGSCQPDNHGCAVDPRRAPVRNDSHLARGHRRALDAVKARARSAGTTFTVCSAVVRGRWHLAWRRLTPRGIHRGAHTGMSWEQRESA